MKKAPFLRVLSWQIRASLRGWHLLVSGLLFAFIGWQGATQAIRLADAAKVKTNVWDAFFIAFAGPAAWGIALVAMLGWFVPHLLFFYMTGDVVCGELQRQGYIILPLIGSRRQWWWSKGVFQLLLSFGYTVWGGLVTLVSAAGRLPWTWEISDLLKSGALWPWPPKADVITLLGWGVLLWGSTLYALGTLQMLMALIGGRSIYALAGIVVIALLSWLLGADQPGLIRWWPGSQSMLLRHTFLEPTIPGFSLAWSLAYNAIVGAAALGVGAWRVQRMDVLGPEETER